MNMDESFTVGVEPIVYLEEVILRLAIFCGIYVRGLCIKQRPYELVLGPIVYPNAVKGVDVVTHDGSDKDIDLGFRLQRVSSIKQVSITLRINSHDPVKHLTACAVEQIVLTRYTGFLR